MAKFSARSCALRGVSQGQAVAPRLFTTKSTVRFRTRFSRLKPPCTQFVSTPVETVVCARFRGTEPCSLPFRKTGGPESGEPPRTRALNQMANAIDLHVGKRLRRRRRLLGAHPATAGLVPDRHPLPADPKIRMWCEPRYGVRLYELAVALNVPVNYFFEGFNNSRAPATPERAGQRPRSHRGRRALPEGNARTDPRLLQARRTSPPPPPRPREGAAGQIHRRRLSIRRLGEFGERACQTAGPPSYLGPQSHAVTGRAFGRTPEMKPTVVNITQLAS